MQKRKNDLREIYINFYRPSMFVCPTSVMFTTLFPNEKETLKCVLASKTAVYEQHKPHV